MPKRESRLQVERLSRARRSNSPRTRLRRIPTDLRHQTAAGSPGGLTFIETRASQAFENRGDTLATANAHCHERVAAPDALQFVDRLDGEKGT